MANYRLIHTQIWRDSWFMDLDPLARYFFIYLFSNEAASVCGLYRLDLRVMQFETSLSREQITAFLERFERDGKAIYRDGVVWVVNLQRYNASSSPKVVVKIKADLAEIPADHPLRIAYQERSSIAGYRSDMVSIPDPENIENSPVSVSGNTSGDISGSDTGASNDAQPTEPPIPDPVPAAKPRRADPRADPRSKSAAIQAARAVANGKYPPAAIWDRLLAVLGEEPDVGKLGKCREEWVARGYNPQNWAGVLEWYVKGVPERGNGSRASPNLAPTPETTEGRKEKYLGGRLAGIMNRTPEWAGGGGK